MKRYLLILLLGAALQASAQKLPTKGYGGDASLALGAAFTPEFGALPVVDVSTTHGYWFNPRFYLGGGVALFNAQFLGLYAQLGGTLRRPTDERPSFPYMMFRAGYAAGLWEGEWFAAQKGVFLEPRFGWSFYSKAGNLRYNVFAAAHLFQLSVVPKIGLTFEF